jgi:hypothetical protein
MRSKKEDGNSWVLILDFGKAVLYLMLLTGKYEKVDILAAMLPGDAERAQDVLPQNKILPKDWMPHNKKSYPG